MRRVLPIILAGTLVVSLAANYNLSKKIGANHTVIARHISGDFLIYDSMNRKNTSKVEDEAISNVRNSVNYLVAENSSERNAWAVIFYVRKYKQFYDLGFNDAETKLIDNYLSAFSAK